MNRTLFYGLLLSSLLIAGRSVGDVAVEILDFPRSVYLFEPVYVTFEVRNQGSQAVVVPAGTCPSEGAFLATGPHSEKLEIPQQYSDCINQRLVRLPPGGRWLFFQHVEPWAEGTFEIAARLRSPGNCTGRPVGPERRKIEPPRPTVWGARPYDCWSGEASSERISVEVKVPDSEVDLSVVQFLKLDRITSSKTLILSFRDLWYRFPASHYTYAAFQATGGGVSMLNIVILQPDNPLNPWVAGAMAVGLAYRDRPCSTHPKSWGPNAAPDLDDRFARVIAAYPPPVPVKAYIHQLEAELAAEECPGSAGEEDQRTP